MIEEGSFLELLANLLAANKKEVRRLDLQNRLSQRTLSSYRASWKNPELPFREVHEVFSQIFSDHLGEFV